MKKKEMFYDFSDFEQFAIIQAFNRCVFEMHQCNKKKQKYTFNDFKHDYYSQIVISDEKLKEIHKLSKKMTKN